MFVRTKMFWGAKSVALVGVLALLAGCSGDGEKSPSPTASSAAATTVDPEEWRAATVDAYESLKVPKEFQASSRVTSFPTVVPATDTLPGLMVATTYVPDERPQVGIWTVAADGTATDPVVLDVGEYGNRAVITSDGETTAIVGRAYKKGEWGLFVARSDDRENWDVDFDPKLSHWVPLAATIQNGGWDVVVVGMNGGKVEGLVASHGNNQKFDLPDPQDPEGTSVVGVASVGEQIVVLRQMTDGPVVNVKKSAYTSAWQTLGLPDAEEATAITQFADGYVVTGRVMTDEFLMVAAAWTSTDGKTWSPESLDLGEANANNSKVYGATAGGGRVLGVVGDPFGDWCGLVERGEGGAWHVVTSVPSSEYCISDRALPLPRSDGGVTVAVEAGTTVVFDQIGPDGSWALSEEPREVYGISPTYPALLGDDVRLAASGFVTGADGAAEPDGALYAVHGKKVVDAKEDVAKEWVDEETGWGPTAIATSSATGVTLVVSLSLESLESWRYTPGDGWERSTDSGEYSFGGALAPVGEGWNLLAGSAIYASDDGLTWTAMTDLYELENGSLNTTPVTMCGVPGGEAALLLGTQQASAGASGTRPAVWLGSDDSWRAVTVTDAPFGELTSCATDGSSVVVGGTTSEEAGEPGVPGVWTSANGRDWEPVALPDNVTVGAIVAVDGGFAAEGKVDGAPVLWLSNGTTWDWIPAPDGFSVAVVYPLGPDLMLFSRFGAPTMTLLPGTAERIAQL